MPITGTAVDIWLDQRDSSRSTAWVLTADSVFRTRNLRSNKPSWINKADKEDFFPGIPGSIVMSRIVGTTASKAVYVLLYAETGAGTGAFYQAVAVTLDDGNTWTVSLTGQTSSPLSPPFTISGTVSSMDSGYGMVISDYSGTPLEWGAYGSDCSGDAMLSMDNLNDYFVVDFGPNAPNTGDTYIIRHRTLSDGDWGYSIESSANGSTWNLEGYSSATGCFAAGLALGYSVRYLRIRWNATYGATYVRLVGLQLTWNGGGTKLVNQQTNSDWGAPPGGGGLTVTGSGTVVPSNAFAVGRHNPDIVYVGGSKIFRSTDGSLNFAEYIGSVGAHDILIPHTGNASDADVLFIGTDGKIYYSTGATPGTAILNTAESPISTQHSRLAVRWSDSTKIYALVCTSTDTFKIVRTPDKGANWSDGETGLYKAKSIQSYQFGPVAVATQRIALVGSDDGGSTYKILRSLDGGATLSSGIGNYGTFSSPVSIAIG